MRDEIVAKWDALPYAQRTKGEFAMQIVDGQIHLWETGLPSVLAHWQVTHFTPEEAIVLMDEAGVDAAVISPPPWDPRSTELALGAVKNYPGRFAIMGSVPPDQPKSHGRIASWRDQPGMLGLRFGFIGDRSVSECKMAHSNGFGQPLKTPVFRSL